MKKHVDLEIDTDVLKEAGIVAATLGVSRRQYLTAIIENSFCSTKAQYLQPKNEQSIIDLNEVLESKI